MSQIKTMTLLEGVHQNQIEKAEKDKQTFEQKWLQVKSEL